MLIKDHYIEIHGQKIYVKKLINNRNKPTIVFLHEGLGSVSMWRDFPEKIVEETGFNGFLYDRSGYGRSGPSLEKRKDDYLHLEAFKWLPEIIKVSGLFDIILLGHSDGGSIALLYASKYRVSGVITEAAHVFVEDVTIKGIREAVKIYETTDLKNKLEKYHGDKTEKVFRDWSDTWLSESFRKWNIEEYLPRIKSPLLVIQGVDDEYATKKQVNSIVSKSGCDAKESMIQNCMHIPHFQAREETISEIKKFIKYFTYEKFYG